LTAVAAALAGLQASRFATSTRHPNSAVQLAAAGSLAAVAKAELAAVL